MHHNHNSKLKIIIFCWDAYRIVSKGGITAMRRTTMFEGLIFNKNGAGHNYNGCMHIFCVNLGNF